MFVIGVSALANGSVQGAIWLFGIGILAWFDFWWPGILILVGLGIIAGSLFPDRKQPQTAEVPESSFPESIPDPQEEYSYDDIPETPREPVLSQPTSSPNWIPSRCPACGAPISADEVIWLDDTHAECSYCHTQLSPK